MSILCSTSGPDAVGALGNFFFKCTKRLSLCYDRHNPCTGVQQSLFIHYANYVSSLMYFGDWISFNAVIPKKMSYL